MKDNIETEKRAAEARAAMQPPAPPEFIDGRDANRGALDQGQGALMEDAKKDPDDDDEEDVVHAEIVQPDLILPGVKADVGKKNAKRRKESSVPSVAGKRMRSKGPAQRSAASTIAGSSFRGDGSSVAASKKESASTSSTGDKEKDPQKIYQRWVEELDIELALQGASLGGPLYHAKRAVADMKKGDDGPIVEAILLQGHIDLFQRAQQLLPRSISKLNAQVRMNIVRDLKHEGITFPQRCQNSLLALAVKECKGDVAKMMSVLQLPHSSEADTGTAAKKDFDPLAPKLCDSDLEETEQCKILHRLLLNEAVVPLICKGDKCFAEVRRVCSGLVSNFRGYSGASM